MEVPLEDPRRFARIDAGDAPLWFDPAAVVAAEPREGGAYALHLAGGQTLELAPAIAAEALKRLGLGGRKASGVRRQASGVDASREAAGLKVSPERRQNAKGRRQKKKEPPPSPAGQIGRYVARLFA